jgi:hypothetical protein
MGKLDKYMYTTMGEVGTDYDLIWSNAQLYDKRNAGVVGSVHQCAALARDMHADLWADLLLELYEKKGAYDLYRHKMDQEQQRKDQLRNAQYEKDRHALREDSFRRKNLEERVAREEVELREGEKEAMKKARIQAMVQRQMSSEFGDDGVVFDDDDDDNDETYVPSRAQSGGGGGGVGGRGGGAAKRPRTSGIGDGGGGSGGGGGGGGGYGSASVPGPLSLKRMNSLGLMVQESSAFSPTTFKETAAQVRRRTAEQRERAIEDERRKLYDRRRAAAVRARERARQCGAVVVRAVGSSGCPPWARDGAFDAGSVANFGAGAKLGAEGGGSGSTGTVMRRGEGRGGGDRGGTKEGGARGRGGAAPACSSSSGAPPPSSSSLPSKKRGREEEDGGGADASTLSAPPPFRVVKKETKRAVKKKKMVLSAAVLSTFSLD